VNEKIETPVPIIVFEVSYEISLMMTVTRAAGKNIASRATSYRDLDLLQHYLIEYSPASL
jgi:hypothetical protein